MCGTQAFGGSIRKQYIYEVFSNVQEEFKEEESSILISNAMKSFDLVSV